MVFISEFILKQYLKNIQIKKKKKKKNEKLLTSDFWPVVYTKQIFIPSLIH